MDMAASVQPTAVAGKEDGECSPPRLAHVRALLTKNWIVKKRHPMATLSEVLNPLLCIIMFAMLKALETDVDVPSGWATDAVNQTATADGVGSKWSLFAKSNIMDELNATLGGAGLSLNTSFMSNSSSSMLASPMSLVTLTAGLDIPKFYFNEATMPGLMLNLALQALMEGDHVEELSETELLFCFLQFGLSGFTSLDPSSPHKVPLLCRGKVIPYKIAITPDTTYTRKYFAAVMNDWYPRLPLVEPVMGISTLTIPSFEESSLFFPDEPALEAYMASEEYGQDLDHPKIYAAIAFQEFPQTNDDIGHIKGHSIDFSLRFNSTAMGGASLSSVPPTKKRRYKTDKFLKSVRPQNTMKYATQGFMTLQTAVMRVLNCLPPWDAATATPDPATCQLKKAMMVSNATMDTRLLRQIEDDLVIGSMLQALSTLRDALSVTPPTSDTMGRIIDAMQSISLSVNGIPSSSKESILRVLRLAPQAFHDAGTFMSPIHGYHYAGFYVKVLVVFPVGFILSYLYGISRVIVALLMEKETRSREFMRILGVQEWQITFTWFVTYLQLFFVASVLQTIGAVWLLFPNSNALLIFAFFFSFAVSCFAYSFLISTLFNRARAGSLIGMGLFFMMFFVSFAFEESSTETVRNLSCLLPPVALAQGINTLAHVEAVGIGISAGTAYDVVESFRFGTAIWMQLLDFVIYCAIGWYTDKVMPKEYGVAEPWHFMFRRSYWRWPSKKNARAGVQHPSLDNDKTGESDELCSDLTVGVAIEVVSAELQQQERDGRAVVIAKLRKEFDVPGGIKVAVKRLSLTLYEGQITCLLGHNGAGKTTLMSMLTGMTAPSSGDALIGGRSICTDMNRIRQSLGYCPQFSVIYPELTVEEHLRFYCSVKGFNGSTAQNDEVNKKIEEVGLTEKRHVQAHALSGGMKRKLSLAIAFLGKSRVVFLDEPTSGMDPYSRRSTWELIQNNKKNRVVILTTHFMDEADILGDRIGIMAEGELRCIGSSLFLKNRFGVGYRLRLVLKQLTHQSGQVQHSDAICAFLRHHIPEAKIATDIGAELTCQLPFETSPRFPALFRELEQHQSELRVESYAISVTTLEEIFLKVAESSMALCEEERKGNTNGNCQTKIDVAVPVKHTPATVNGQSTIGSGHVENNSPDSRFFLVWFFIQMRALLLKRILSAKRDKSMLFYSVLLPIVILFAGLSALKHSILMLDDPKVPLTTTDQFELGERTPVPFACVEAGGGGMDNANSWCNSVMDATVFTGGIPSQLPIEPIVYGGKESPLVFGVTYDSPSISPNDTTGYCVRFGELSYERGYGYDSQTYQSLQQAPIEGQYGGFVIQGTRADQILAYNIMVNSSASHAAPTYKALIDDAVHRFLLANGTLPLSQSQQSVRIRVSTHPFPLSFKTRSIFGSFLSLPAVMFVLIAFTFIPASMMPFLVKEKQPEQNSRHQQVLSGVSLTAYWLANFVFDLCVYFVPMASAIVLLRMYGITSSLNSMGSDSNTCTGCTQDVPQAVLTLFCLFGTAIVPWTYLMSHLMSDPGACLLYTVMFNFLLGLVILLVSYSMTTIESTRATNEVLIYLWRCSPLFSLANGLLQVIVNDIQALYGLSLETRSAFSSEIAGTEIAYLAIEGPLFFALTLAIDLVKTGEMTLCGRDFRHMVEAWRQRWHAGALSITKLHAQEVVDAEANTADVDEDVRIEAQRMLSQIDNQSMVNPDEVVRILRLQKTYANGKRALSDLSFGLQRGDCFGYLGINGAGKTTTMKILTGALFPSYGTAQLNGFDILEQRRFARQNIGYCPQFDALLDLLTVREHLEFYGRLKGFARQQLDHQVARLLTQFQLYPFERKLAGSLSGGNKRKLSVAIAMIGDPVLLFLDEPSTGMDPFSRRFMWDIILQVSVQSRRSTIMLTTHSMEECEALCNRAGIMVGGKLCCFGTIPHLKQRFGDGYLLECKLEYTDDACIGELVARLPDSADPLSFTQPQIAEVCQFFGRPDRADWVLSPQVHPTGCVLYEQLHRSGGTLSTHDFCAWWILEDRVENLLTYLQSQYGIPNVKLVERQTDFCRIKLSVQELALENDADTDESTLSSLSRIFGVIEESRSQLHIKEYSIAPTSLEQIFNSFARHQQEEQTVARSFWTPSSRKVS